MPEGQVVARVDGEDVTLRDLAAEAQAQGASPDAAAEIRGPILAQVTDRKLLAHAARERRIDRSPDYLAALRRQREELLAAMLGSQIAAGLSLRGSSDAYIHGHPWMFAQRRIFLLEVIEARAGERSLGTLPNMDRIAATLRRSGQDYTRTTSRLDSYALSREEAARLNAVAIGKPTAMSRGDAVRIVAVTDRRPAPLLGGVARQAAAAAMHREQVAKAIAELLAAKRRHATIRYQSGFGPAAR